MTSGSGLQQLTTVPERRTRVAQADQPPTVIVGVTDSAATGFLRGQLAYMRGKGLDVKLVSSPGALAEQVAETQQVHYLPVPMKREMAPGEDIVSLWRLVAIMRKERPALVSVATPKAGLLGMLAARLCRVPCRVYMMWGLRLETTSGLKRIVLFVCEKLACRLAHRVLCNSPSLRQRAVDLGIVPAEKAVVLGSGSSHGVDAARFHRTPEVEAKAQEIRRELGIPEDGLVVGFVGRLVRDKGVDELMAAWARLREEFPNLRMLLVGGSEAADPISDDARVAIESDPRVHTTGQVDDPVPYYAVMSILALPTYREGFPNVPLEAAAMELPVVGTEVTGCVDAIADGVTGTVVPPRDPDALAEAIRAYLRDPELRRKHGQAGRERVLRDFRPEDIWEGIYQEYLNLLTARGLPVPDGESEGREPVTAPLDHKEGGP